MHACAHIPCANDVILSDLLTDDASPFTSPLTLLSIPPLQQRKGTPMDGTPSMDNVNVKLKV